LRCRRQEAGRISRPRTWPQLAKDWQRKTTSGRRRHIRSRHGPRVRPGTAERERHDQVEKPLHKLRGKVGSCVPPTLAPAFLPQSMQGRFPCKNGEGLCAPEKVAWMGRSQNERQRHGRRCLPIDRQPRANLWHLSTSKAMSTRPRFEAAAER